MDSVDRFHGHVVGMDTFARGLEVAHAIRKDGVFEEFIDDRYASYEGGSARTLRTARPTW